jgi:hypothetical protein
MLRIFWGFTWDIFEGVATIRPCFKTHIPPSVFFLSELIVNFEEGSGNFCRNYGKHLLNYTSQFLF